MPPPAQADIELIRQQAAADVAAGMAGAAAIPDASAGQAAVVAAVTQWVHAAIAADRKITSLKALQGHVWQSGFQSGALKAELFRWGQAVADAVLHACLQLQCVAVCSPAWCDCVQRCMSQLCCFLVIPICCARTCAALCGAERRRLTGARCFCHRCRDVPDALTEWRNSGLKTYIYSSGSRLAQRLLFGHCTAGDLRTYLHGFFDTTSGPKVGGPGTAAAAAAAAAVAVAAVAAGAGAVAGVTAARHASDALSNPSLRCSCPNAPSPPPPQVEAASYKEIALALGVDSPADILFATDALAEAQAADAAGWRAVLVERPGNKPLPAGHKFRVISSMTQLLQ
jgi:methionine salvage enolase-phosphatase E1